MPASARPSVGLTIEVGGTAELERSLFVTIRPAGSPCGASYEIEDDESQDATYAAGVQGTIDRRETVDPLERGTYELCGYVQESTDDASPEAVAAAKLAVGSPISEARCAVNATRRYRFSAVRAKAIGCSTASQALRRGRLAKGRYRLAGWACRRTESAARGGRFRCARGKGTISFIIRRR